MENETLEYSIEKEEYILPAPVKRSNVCEGFQNKETIKAFVSDICGKVMPSTDLVKIIVNVTKGKTTNTIELQCQDKWRYYSTQQILDEFENQF